MRKSIIKRLLKIERRTFQPRWRVVTKDYDGLYRGECGDGLSQEQFDAWVNGQDKDTQVIIVEVKVENYPFFLWLLFQGGLLWFFEFRFMLKVERYC